jgi:glycerol uptake facilitator-like aquaporin
MSGRIAPRLVAEFTGTFAFVFIGTGALFLSAVLAAHTSLGAPALAHNLALAGRSLTITPAAGFMIEALLAFFLVTVVLGPAVADRAGNLAPLAIGMTLTLNITIGRALTTAAFNPARALGPMVAVGNFRDAWLCLIPPIVGAIAAAIVHMGMARPLQEQTVMSKPGPLARTLAE